VRLGLKYGITYNTIMNLVIDTNVLVAGLKSSRGASYQLLMAVVKDLYIPCVSVPLFVEYEAVLKREGLLPHMQPLDDAVLDYLLSRSIICQIFFLWRPFLKDPQSDLVLEAAVASQSKFIITFNLRDFAGVEEAFGIRVVTPQIYLSERGLI
jgi:putative PIN family toxin of toxin-antitoxin system